MELSDESKDEIDRKVHRAAYNSIAGNGSKYSGIGCAWLEAWTNRCNISNPQSVLPRSDVLGVKVLTGRTRMRTDMTPELDVTLSNAIQDAFHHTGRSWLIHLKVEVAAGAVVLRGSVPNYYLKQLAQETVLTVPGVAGLRNELEVAPRTT